MLLCWVPFTQQSVSEAHLWCPPTSVSAHRNPLGEGTLRSKADEHLNGSQFWENAVANALVHVFKRPCVCVSVGAESVAAGQRMDTGQGRQVRPGSVVEAM